MKYQINPFTPGFGEIPLYMAGRELVINNMFSALCAPRRTPELSSIFIGPRGSGKTALLAYIAQQAQANGWVVASVSATPGMLDDILIQTRRSAAHLVKTSDSRRITGISIAKIVGINWENIDRENWRSTMSEILEQLNEANVGLLITVDEVNSSLDEMIQFASIYQHFVSENRKVALLMAGLPTKVISLLTNKQVSFLRRAEQVRLGRINDQDVAFAFRRTIEQEGRTINDNALTVAVKGVDGFAYMLQLVGFRSWNQHPQNEVVSEDDVQQGIELAHNDFCQRILEASYREMSNMDRRFAKAMLNSPNPSTLAEIAQRMGKTTSYVSRYKSRLIEQGIITQRIDNKLDFELPFFRQYLLDIVEEGLL